jgi:hypothetical protein
MCPPIKIYCFPAGMTGLDRECYYIFRWQNRHITDHTAITPERCLKAEDNKKGEMLKAFTGWHLLYLRGVYG